MARYDYESAPRDRDIWACAYTTTSTEKNMSFRREPVLGQIKGLDGYWAKFYEYKRNGQLKVKGVSVNARIYTDTYEECVDLYNELIDKQIKKLEDLITENRNNKI